MEVATKASYVVRQFTSDVACGVDTRLHPADYMFDRKTHGQNLAALKRTQAT